MKVYVINKPDNINVKEVLDLLPEWRKQKALSYGSESDRISCGVSYLLLQYAIKENYGFFETDEFFYGKVGKPYLSQHSNIFFSISHCRNALCCCVGKNEMGVDIQDIRPYKERTARRVCTENEKNLLNSSDNPDRLFSIMWSVKESVGKMTGHGFQEGFGRIDAAERIKNNSSSIYETADYIISLTVKDHAEQIEAVPVSQLLSCFPQRL